jgi:integrase
MAFVYKRGGIYYVGYRITVLDENGKKVRKQISEPVSPDKQAAEEYAAKKTLNEYADKKKLLKRDIPIQTFYEEYQKNYSSKNKREKTLHRDNLIWKTFKRVCPEVVVTEQFDDTTLNNYMHRRIANGKMNGEKLKKASVNREIGMLKNLARWGYKKRYLSSNYYDLVDAYPETDSQKKRPFTDKEIQKIIDNTKYPQLEAHILSIWHGMRAGEITTLECSDFVWSINPKTEKDYIKIRNKPHLNTLVKTKQSERDVPIHPFWRTHLKKVWEQDCKKSNFFLVTFMEESLTTGGLSSYTRKLFKKLKFTPKELSFHSGRHTYATRIKDGGGSINLASKSLGHSNTGITEEVYTDFKPHEHFNVVDYIKINVKKPTK